ncbi:hypothetical protein KP509_18G076200 [Ceratopteris richardii]|nr:hypothetical protein KP509_18G076200 [Ceratopteris richardii]
MAGAVLNTLNIRLNAQTMANLLEHSGSKIVFVDYQYLSLVHNALTILSSTSSITPIAIVIKDQLGEDECTDYPDLDYETLLERGDPSFPFNLPSDEWDTISLNYTSGTTSQPKGVLYHHRGAYMNSLMHIMMWRMKDFPVFLWTVPMFHCNGWCFTWAVAAQGGTNICIRNVTAKNVFSSILKHKVEYLAGAPVLLNMLASASPDEVEPFPSLVHVLTGGAPPPPSVLARMEELGFDITHAYGLTETYGCALYCRWKPEWNLLPHERRSAFKARQGIATHTVTEAAVMNPSTMRRVPSDGKTIGEVMIRGIAVMKGYFKNEPATREAFRGGWFHTGDLSVMHPDGYVQLKDRSKDIIISGGENISSIEVETILYSHPQVIEAAVVARPDEHWGETPCAFVHVMGNTTAENIIAYCRERLPHFMAPRSVVFGELPKTATGKVQKFVLRERAKALGPLLPGITRSSKL